MRMKINKQAPEVVLSSEVQHLKFSSYYSLLNNQIAWNDHKKQIYLVLGF